ncbi:MAG: hypothetical protein NTX82_00755 [Candidatus Parcubacteria bacterium]|nr:hypothetical protein [Candidatus Parcubacteria bacterium]
MEREDGWEGDLISRILVVGQGKERRVWILTDRGKYQLGLEELEVIQASGEFSLPLFDPDKKKILIGQETELHRLGGKDRRLVEKVGMIALACMHS